MLVRRVAAEFLGTAVLVFFGAGAATLSFGFKLFGLSPAAGIVATALTFGLVLLALVYALGPLSGCHVNPAVTIGFALAGRMAWRDAVAYWVAQLAGGIVGALLLWAVLSASAVYDRTAVGLGVDGWGAASILGLNLGGALLAEIILSFAFVMVVLSVTSYAASAAFAGLAIGTALAAVHLVGIPLTGTSVNPARSLGPALVVGGTPLAQVWLFFVGPLAGGAIAAAVWRWFNVPRVAPRREVPVTQEGVAVEATQRPAPT